MTEQTKESITQLTTILIDDEHRLIDLEGFVDFESIKSIIESHIKQPIFWNDNDGVGFTADGCKISFIYQTIHGKATVSDFQALALAILLTFDRIERQCKDTLMISLPPPFMCENIDELMNWMTRFCARIDELRHLATTGRLNPTLGPQGEADWKRICEKTLAIAGPDALEIPALWKKRFVIAHQAFVLEETPIPDNSLLYENLASYLKPEESQIQPANAA